MGPAITTGVARRTTVAIALKFIDESACSECRRKNLVGSINAGPPLYKAHNPHGTGSRKLVHALFTYRPMRVVTLAGSR